MRKRHGPAWFEREPPSHYPHKAAEEEHRPENEQRERRRGQVGMARACLAGHAHHGARAACRRGPRRAGHGRAGRARRWGHDRRGSCGRCGSRGAGRDRSRLRAGWGSHGGRERCGPRRRRSRAGWSRAVDACRGGYRDPWQLLAGCPGRRGLGCEDPRKRCERARDAHTCAYACVGHADSSNHRPVHVTDPDLAPRRWDGPPWIA